MKKSAMACSAVYVALLIFSGHLVAAGEGYIMDAGVKISPSLTSTVKYDDNIFHEGIDETSSSIVTAAPAVNLLLDDGINRYSADLGFESASHTTSKADNYSNRFLTLSGHLEPSSRSRWDLSANIIHAVEPRGTGITEGAGDAMDEPLEFDAQTAQVSYEYGALSTQGLLALEVNYYNKNYSNFSVITEVMDFDSVLFGGMFFYSTNSKTDAFIEINQNAIRYDINDPSGSRDSDDVYALLGVKWEATALTTGEIKLGLQRKNFTKSDRKDFSGFSWGVNVDWQPLTYSTVSVNTSRNATDPSSYGDYINKSIVGISWLAQWNSRVSTTVGASYEEEEYIGATMGRTDDTRNYNAIIDFVALPWLGLSVFLELTDKDSDLEGIAFKKNVVGISLKATK
ncbi:MAG: hypothetical protein COA99_12590 [Moraxellaceae bacterium]|nr:MAG: hypothetical protein COA99_12590 [Moraxellaceae bacterium]